MKAAHLPLAEEGWVALERESVDALVVRRRMEGEISDKKASREGWRGYRRKRGEKAESLHAPPDREGDVSHGR